MGDAPQLFTQNDNGEYEAFTPPSFQESIPENLRENELFKEIADTGQMAAKLVELHSALPQKPENPDGYELSAPKDFPIADEDITEFKKVAHDLNLTPAQFTGIMNHYFEREVRTADQFRADVKAHREKSMGDLKAEFGEGFDDKLTRAGAFIRAIGEKMGEGKSDEFAKWLDDTKFGDDTMVIRLFAAAADLIGEDTLILGDSGENSETRPVGSDGKPRLKFESMGDK